MKERKELMQVTIRGESPEDFDRKVNKILREHADAKIEREPNAPMMCYMTYTEDVLEAESLRDEYELAGCTLKCRSCPYIRKSEDRRRKKHFCPVKQATVRLDMYCCEEFFKAVEEGRIIIERRPELEIA